VLRLALELSLEVVEQSVVKVLSTKVGVTGGGLDGEDTADNREERNIERSTSKVEDEDGALLFVLVVGRVETVRNGGGGGLVDDPENVEASNRTSVLGGETLGVVEVGRDGDDGLLDCLADLGLSSLLQLGKNHGRDLSRGELPLLAEVVDLDGGGSVLVDDLEGEVLDVLLDLGIVETAADKTLSVEDGRVRVHGSLILGCVTNESLLGGEGDV